MEKLLLPGFIRPLLEPHLPENIVIDWWMTPDEATAKIGDADVAWVDQSYPPMMFDLLSKGKNLKWLSTVYAGLDSFPTAFLKEQNIKVTNGIGINSIAVAEYAVLGMLALAKRYDEVVRAAARKEWLQASPGTVELDETRALIVGYGSIGSAIGDRLRAFGVDITGVARTARPDQGILAADEWKDSLPEYDWVILATPSTDETVALLGAAEISRMKKTAFVVNIARGSCIDQDALVAACLSNDIAGAFLDVTTPEPLPDDHILWQVPNILLSMHLSGRSQTKMFARSSELFLSNLKRYLAGEPLTNQVDLKLGY